MQKDFAKILEAREKTYLDPEPLLNHASLPDDGKRCSTLIKSDEFHSNNSQVKYDAALRVMFSDMLHGFPNRITCTTA
jgi:hypothetical protein